MVDVGTSIKRCSKSAEFIDARAGVGHCMQCSGSYVCDGVFTIKYSDNSLESIGFPVKQQNDNTWKFYGDQSPMDASVNPVTWRTKDGSSQPTTVAGFNVSVRPVNNAYTANGPRLLVPKFIWVRQFPVLPFQLFPIQQTRLVAARLTW